MNTSSFGKATVIIIIVTAVAFLAAFSSGVPATQNLMAPWSALAFVIVGCTLWIGGGPRIAGPAWHRVGAILVFAIGAILCGEYLFHASSTAFDRLLFPTLLPRDIPLPGRPAQIAGFRYVLLGLMLWLLRTGNRRLVLAREWIAVTILTLSYFGFIAVMSTWGTAAPDSISPFAAILGILAAANVLVRLVRR